MDVEIWLFDLDNTLYHPSCRLFDQVDRRMGEFIQNHLGLDAVAAKALQKTYFREHGTTLRGLMTNHGIAPETYLDYVHRIDLSPVTHSPALDAALADLPGRKLIFTNASTAHADAVLDRLGVAHHFEAVFDVAAAAWLPKPHPEPYRRLLERHAVDPRRAAFVEDTQHNLEPAHALGMTTVWARPPTAEAPPADYVHHHTDDLVAWLRDVAVPAARTAAPRR